MFLNLNNVTSCQCYVEEFTLYIDPDLMKFFSKTLSSEGSRSSSISSMRSGLPRDKASSKCCRKYLWFKDVTCTLRKL